MIERLADLPRPALLLHLRLQITPGHVQPETVAEHVIQRVFHGDVAPAAAQRHHRLDLVVNVR
jgi:hypothetical protein